MLTPADMSDTMVPRPLPTKAGVPVIAFTSGKGGCGKTTLAVNFANVVSQSKSRVLIIDMDMANRGCTGLFSRQTKTPHSSLTVTRILRDDWHTDQQTRRSILEVKDNLFLMPASSAGEDVWTLPEDTNLADFVEDLHSKIQKAIEDNEIDCVVLDCFCGIDKLTTASAAVADHTLIVNEPDIITFTGAIHLLNHLQCEFQQLSHQPNLHFVVNRVKSTYTVAQLNELYENNLKTVIADRIILCYFPYHERIFMTFGTYPFISDLLPRSLFTRKLELLTYLLFKGTNDKLLKPRVQHLSKRKVRTIYYQSIDASAVDSDYLVFKLSNYAILLGLWLIVGFVLLRLVPLTPFAAWFFVLVLGASLTTFTTTSLIYGFWLAARLNFSLAEFRYRLGLVQTKVWGRAFHFLGTLFPVLTGGLMTLAVVALGVGSMTGTCVFLDMMFNIGYVREASPHLRDRIIEIAIKSPARTINLKGQEVRNVEFGERSFVDDNVSTPLHWQTAWDAAWGWLQRGTFLAGDNTHFARCRFDADLFPAGSEWQDCAFDACVFNLNAEEDGERRTNRARISSSVSSEIQARSRDINVLTIQSEKWQNVVFQAGFKAFALDISNCSLRNVTLDLRYGDSITLRHCSLQGSKVYGPEQILSPFLSPLKIAMPMPNVALKSEMDVHGHVILIPLAPSPGASLKEKIAYSMYRLDIYRKNGYSEKNQSSYMSILGDLIEWCILAGEYKKAFSLSKELRTKSSQFGDEHHTGVAYMQQLMLCILLKSSPSQQEKAFQSWAGWLKRNPHGLTSWEWSTWESYYSQLKLSSEEKTELDAIRLSAEGNLKPSTLRVILRRALKK